MRSRVVHITTVHDARDPRIFRKEARSLAKHYDVKLIAPGGAAGRIDGVKIFPLPARSRAGRIGRLIRAYCLALALKADVYHFHDPELIPVAWLLKRKTGARLIYDMHEDYAGRGALSGRFLRALETWCFSWADHVFLAESYYRSIVERRTSRFSELLNYFLDDGPVPPPPPPAEAPFILLYAGVQGDARGLRTMLRIAEIIKRRGLPWRIVLAGVCYRADDRASADRAIDAAGLDGIVERIGWDRYVPWEELRPLFRKAHAGLALYAPLRNYIHSVPTKFYEYMHHGLPVLCSDFPRWKGFVEGHDIGAVVPHDDPEAAVAALEEWFNNPDLLQKLSSNAREAAPAYRWEKMEERLFAVYREIG